MERNMVYTALTQPAMFGPLPIYYMLTWLTGLSLQQVMFPGLITFVLFGAPSFLFLFFAAQKEPRYLEMLAVKRKCFGMNEALGAPRHDYSA